MQYPKLKLEYDMYISTLSIDFDCRFRLLSVSSNLYKSGIRLSKFHTSIATMSVEREQTVDIGKDVIDRCDSIIKSPNDKREYRYGFVVK